MVQRWDGAGIRLVQAPDAAHSITAMAISFGAPFWFDLLNRLMVVRSTVKPQEKSPPEASKDLQTLTQQKAPQAPAQPLAGIGAGAAAAAGPALLAAAGTGGQGDADLDGCDCAVEDVTKDEELPVAEGGVA